MATIEQHIDLIQQANKITKPTSWPKQAKLAAEGKTEALKTLQEKLTRGISKEK